MGKLIEKIKIYFKSDSGHDVAIVTFMIIVGMVSFYLGRLSINTSANTTAVADAKENLISEKNISQLKNTTSVQKSSTSTLPLTQKEGRYVASVNGTKYYPLDCSSVSRIKEENKVFFNSQSEAETAGYSKSTTCSNY